MNEKALHTLEYDKIIEKLEGYAVSPMAKERAAALRPSADMSDIILWQEETTEATTMVLKKGTPSFGGFREIRPQLKRASMAGILSIAELMSVGEFAYVCRKVKNYARKENKDEVKSAAVSFRKRRLRMMPAQDCGLFAVKSRPPMKE